MSDPRFPIGKFSYSGPLSATEKKQCIDNIEQAPALYRQAVRGLTDAQLDTPYREGGWTVRQVVHHVPDSHLNAYVRLKLALTEEKPTIKPYNEAAWAELADSKNVPIEVSLAMLESVHTRFDSVWRSLKPEQFARLLVHPENG